MSDTLGLYLSIPFCQAKCSFCNFASGVFPERQMQTYVDRLCAEIRQSHTFAQRNQATLPNHVDSIYFGGGTPSLLPPALFRQVFDTLHTEFDIHPEAEITVECAPNQLAPETLEELQRQRTNRLSFGVQSFIDRESAAIGRLHTERQCLEEFARMSRAGVPNLSLDLIAGLPHQTAASWLHSLDQAIATGVDHVSVYMLEIDEDSRLGREALAQGPRYGAPSLPPEDETADWYLAACDRLNVHAMEQYEISNFSKRLFQSKHNLKYWKRHPYLGFGLDAHSMLLTGLAMGVAIRWANNSDLDLYLAATSPDPLQARFVAPEIDHIDADAAFEETLFLGLRLNEGLNLEAVEAQFGPTRLAATLESLHDIEQAGLLHRQGTSLRLTAAGRTVSNEVFSRLLLTPV